MQFGPQLGPHEATAEDVHAQLERGRSLVPEHLWAGIRNHVLDGCPTGDLLRYVFENNLLEAACRMDEVSHQRIGDLMRFMHNYAPETCWGSAERVQRWRDAGGIRGGAHELVAA